MLSSIQLCLIDWPLTGADKNCHDFPCWAPTDPMLMYRSTIAWPLIELPEANLPTLAVPKLSDTKVRLPPVFKILLLFPKDKDPVIFKVSLRVEAIESPAVLLT